MLANIMFIMIKRRISKAEEKKVNKIRDEVAIEEVGQLVKKCGRLRRRANLLIFPLVGLH